MYEGYGLTETTAPCAFNPLGVPYHQGSVGVAFPGFELRIAEDEEIQVKGTAVFPKYHKNEEASEDSFTEDGWYRTGDLGRIDDDGFLYIIGRKKDLIITAAARMSRPSRRRGYQALRIRFPGLGAWRQASIHFRTCYA